MIPVLEVPVLEVRGLVKRYGDATVLDRVDLTVGEHQVVTLIGSSGSGKSTLLRCVDLLEEIDDGQVLLDGLDVSDPRVDTATAQRRMAIVFQAFNLFPHMTALQNIALAPRVVHRVPAEEADERAHELLRRVGLADRADAHPDRLSGGQQQRVAIARALAMEPDILLMDEPFAALDALTRRKMQDELLQLWDETQFTVLFVTHSIAEAIKIGNRILLLSPHPGQVKAELNSTGRDGEAVAAQKLESEIHAMLFAEAVEEEKPVHV